MFQKLIIFGIVIQTIGLFFLLKKVEVLEKRIESKENTVSEGSLIIHAMNQVNDRLKFVEDGIPEIQKRNNKAKLIKEIVKSNIRNLKENNFKSEHELNEFVFSVLDFSEKYKVPASLILAVSRAESNFNARAISKTRAKGIMQIVDTTFDFCGISLNKSNQDVFYVRDSVQCGAWYLKYLINKFSGDVDLAIKAYNVGPAYIQKFSGENLPMETIDYHHNVTNFMADFKARLQWEK